MARSTKATHALRTQGALCSGSTENYLSAGTVTVSLDHARSNATAAVGALSGPESRPLQPCQGDPPRSCRADVAGRLWRLATGCAAEPALGPRRRCSVLRNADHPDIVGTTWPYQKTHLPALVSAQWCCHPPKKGGCRERGCRLHDMT